MFVQLTGEFFLNREHKYPVSYDLRMPSNNVMKEIEQTGIKINRPNERVIDDLVMRLVEEIKTLRKHNKFLQDEIKNKNEEITSIRKDCDWHENQNKLLVEHLHGRMVKR